MTKNQVHEWHENRPEDGRKRYFRAYWNSKVWIFRKTDPEDEDWVLVDPPTPKLWQDLHGVLFRKYQRRRLPYRLLQMVEAQLDSMGLTPPKVGTP
jgi:hypothetical protein